MAVEKLILRSIYYAVDKIPDKWFHSVPGGYYRNKNGEIKKVRSRSRGIEREERGKSRYGIRTAREEDFYGETHHFDRGRRNNRHRRSYEGDEDEDDEYYQYYEDDRRGRSKSRGMRRNRDRYTPDYSSHERPRHDDARASQTRSARSVPRADDSSWRYSRTIYRKPDAPPIQPPPIGAHRASPLDPKDCYVPYGDVYRSRGQPLPRSRTFTANIPTGKPSNGASSQVTASEDPWSWDTVPSRSNQQSSFRYPTSAAASRDGATSDKEPRPRTHDSNEQRSHQSREPPMHRSQARTYDIETNLYQDASRRQTSTRHKSSLQYEQRDDGRNAQMQAQERPRYHDQREPWKGQSSSQSNRYYTVRREPDLYERNQHQRGS